MRALAELLEMLDDMLAEIIAPVDVLAVLRRHVALAEEVASPDQIAEARGVLASVAELVEALQEIAECTTPGDGVPNTDWVHERARTALARVDGES